MPFIRVVEALRRDPVRAVERSDRGVGVSAAAVGTGSEGRSLGNSARDLGFTMFSLGLIGGAAGKEDTTAAGETKAGLGSMPRRVADHGCIYHHIYV